jgi:hypothetical protein
MVRNVGFTLTVMKVQQSPRWRRLLDLGMGKRGLNLDRIGRAAKEAVQRVLYKIPHEYPPPLMSGPSRAPSHTPGNTARSVSYTVGKNSVRILVAPKDKGRSYGDIVFNGRGFKAVGKTAKIMRFRGIDMNPARAIGRISAGLREGRKRNTGWAGGYRGRKENVTRVPEFQKAAVSNTVEFKRPGRAELLRELRENPFKAVGSEAADMSHFRNRTFASLINKIYRRGYVKIQGKGPFGEPKVYHLPVALKSPKYKKYAGKPTEDLYMVFTRKVKRVSKNQSLQAFINENVRVAVKKAAKETVNDELSGKKTMMQANLERMTSAFGE